MRLAWTEKDFIEALRSAKKEALTAFGNDHVILEKFIDDPKHIEVQIIADKHGGCTKSPQKVIIKETCSTFSNETVRSKDATKKS